MRKESVVSFKKRLRPYLNDMAVTRSNVVLAQEASTQAFDIVAGKIAEYLRVSKTLALLTFVAGPPQEDGPVKPFYAVAYYPDTGEKTRHRAHSEVIELLTVLRAGGDGIKLGEYFWLGVGPEKRLVVRSYFTRELGSIKRTAKRWSIRLIHQLEVHYDITSLKRRLAVLRAYTKAFPEEAKRG